MAESPERSQPSKKLNQSNGYLKYSGLAIQLLGAIAVTGWIGHKIDQWQNLKYPIWMILLGFLGFAGSLYQVYRSLTKDQS
jgi:F0F1-type ATP synthase assembly protein I